MLSNDIKKLHPGEGCYAALLTNQGRMESDLHVFSFEEEIWMECPVEGKDRILANLNKYLISDIVELEDFSDRIGILSFQGPRSKEQIEECLDIKLDLAQLAHTVIKRAGRQWVVVRRDRSGCDGYDLWLPRNEFRDCWNDWVEIRGIPPAGNEALNRLRTEAGIPVFGVDMETRHLPLEFGLKNAVSLNKGCYRGQEIMARVTYRGHLNRGLGGIAVAGTGIPPHGTPVMAGGQKAGEISSAAFSPRLGCPLALAVLKQDFLNPGTPVEILFDDAQIPGKVISLPLT
jgi:folate-binding protein YgfZ